MKLDSDNLDSLFLLGVLNYQLGNFKPAIEYFQRAKNVDPASSEVYYNLANALRKKGQPDEAKIYYLKTLQLNPGIFGAYHNLGIIAMQEKRIDEAIAYFQKVLTLDPNFYNAYYYLGILLQAQGQLDEAIDYFKQTLRLNPNDYEVFDKLGIALQEKGALDDAASCFTRAIQINPDYIEAYNDLGCILIEQGKNEEAIAFLDKAIDMEPHCFRGRLAKCISQLRIIYPDTESISASRNRYREELLRLEKDILFDDSRYIDAASEAIGTVHPFYLAYQGLNDCDLQNIYGRIVCKIMARRYPQFTEMIPMPSRSHGEPIRVGIVSRFFYRHSVWKIPIKGWAESLDRRRFSLYGYCTGRRKDEVTEVARRCFTRFHEDFHSIEELCSRIRLDNLHVLIYPEIGMDELTVKLAALRLAPVQCVSLGHPDTTGFPTIDYYLSSELMETPEADAHYAEKLVRLPNLSFFYKPPEIPSTPMDRGTLGLPAKAVLYLCCQSLFKYLPQYDVVFPRIAKNVDTCKFLFISHPSEAVTDQFRERISRAFDRQHMKADDHVIFLSRLDADQYQAANLLSDVFLDSIGWSGNNTTFEAIACNLPIVTLPGTLMRARHCSAVLRMMGLTETIAASVEEYVAIASRLGQDVRWRHEISERIKCQKYRIYQDTESTSALEDFLEQIVENSNETS